MKCKVCGAESGKYPLCRSCNIKKEKGEIIKCAKCNNWHYIQAPCPNISIDSDKDFLYSLKHTLISKNEQGFYEAIKNSVPAGFNVFPQINLATFISRTDDARFHNELFRNIDFLITDEKYQPKIIIEINDQTHLNPDRKERDEKVKKICEEAGIPIIKLWTSYGVNAEYIKSQIEKQLEAIPIARIHHFNNSTASQAPANRDFSSPISTPHSPITQHQSTQKKKNGCYVATCVYGSYDCPQVWVLRRYRDSVLAKTWYGKAFITLYYAISPTLVQLFGSHYWFKRFSQKHLDIIIHKLCKRGFKDTPYRD